MGHLTAKKGFYGHFNANDPNGSPAIGRHGGAGRHVQVDSTTTAQFKKVAVGYENTWANKINFIFEVGKENPVPTDIAAKCDNCRGFYEEESTKQFIGSLVTTDPAPTCGEFTYVLDQSSLNKGFTISEYNGLFLQRDHDRETQGTSIVARVKTTDTVRKECGITGTIKHLWKDIVVPVLNVPEPPTAATLQCQDPVQSLIILL
jgi:hypothetical protein